MGSPAISAGARDVADVLCRRCAVSGRLGTFHCPFARLANTRQSQSQAEKRPEEQAAGRSFKKSMNEPGGTDRSHTPSYRRHPRRTEDHALTKLPQKQCETDQSDDAQFHPQIQERVVSVLQTHCGGVDGKSEIAGTGSRPPPSRKGCKGGMQEIDPLEVAVSGDRVIDEAPGSGRDRLKDLTRVVRCPEHHSQSHYDKDQQQGARGSSSRARRSLSSPPSISNGSADRGRDPRAARQRHDDRKAAHNRDRQCDASCSHMPMAPDTVHEQRKTCAEGSG